MFFFVRIMFFLLLAGGISPRPSWSAPIAADDAAVAPQPFVYPAGLLRQGAVNDRVIVDVRSGAQYGRFHIPGAINIPLEFVPAKRFLRRVRVVLVNDGFRLAPLLRARGKMLRRGFSRVFILYGGIAGWIRNGGAVDGDIAAAGGTVIVDPEDLYRELPRNDVIGVDVSTAEIHSGTEHGLKMTSLRFDPGKDGGFRAAIANLGKDRQRTTFLVVDAGGGYEEMIRATRAMADNIFFLAGGWKGWRACLERHRQRVEKRRVNSGPGCPVCPR